MNLSNQQKAIAGGVVTAIVALFAHFGWQPDGQAMNFLNIVVTIVTGYIVGHLGVYFAPRNVDPSVEPPLNHGA